jgi:hypothetical protein
VSSDFPYEYEYYRDDNSFVVQDNGEMYALGDVFARAGPEALAKFMGISFQEAKAFADKENSNDSRNLPPGTLGSGSGNDPVYIFVSTP